MATGELSYIAVYKNFMSRRQRLFDVGFDRGHSSAVARVNFSDEQGPDHLLDIYWTFRVGFHRQVRVRKHHGVGGGYEPAPGMIITRSLPR